MHNADRPEVKNDEEIGILAMRSAERMISAWHADHPGAAAAPAWMIEERLDAKVFVSVAMENVRR